MATYQIRNLFCLLCDRSVRARNQIVDGVEQEGKCPSCNHELIQRPSLNLTLPLGPTGILGDDCQKIAFRGIWSHLPLGEAKDE